MSIQITEEEGGSVLAVHVAGTLVNEDYERFVKAFERHALQHEKLRLLFDMTEFHGWDSGASWEDTKFSGAHFTDIKRLVMVGDNKWQHGMSAFCRPFTKATIRYFGFADALRARQWLNEA